MSGTPLTFFCSEAKMEERKGNDTGEAEGYR